MELHARLLARGDLQDGRDGLHGVQLELASDAQRQPAPRDVAAVPQREPSLSRH